MKMVPTGNPGAHPRQNSGLQPVSVPSQPLFSSIVSPRTQFNGVNNNIGLLGNMNMSMPNVSSLLSHSFGNGGSTPGGGISAAGLGIQQRAGSIGGGMDMLTSAEADSMSFTSSSGAPSQGHHHFENQLGSDHQQSPHLDTMQGFQQQFALPHNQHQQQQQLQRGLGSMGNLGTVKAEPQMSCGDQNGLTQSLRGIGAVKQEPPQLQPIQNIGQIKLEPQHMDSSLFLQQQQQQLLQMSRHSSQAAAAAQLNMMQQQQIMQIRHQQQQQQQQILKNLPQQRTQLQQLQQNLPTRPQGKPIMYEPGMCARRLTHFMYHQQHRPEDNNIEFWRKFVAEYFAPSAKKRWCVSLYGSGRQTNGVFPQDVWHCEICNRKPGRGFETTVEVLPRLCQIKYASGTLEELLYVDMPREYQNASGQIVLDYAKAIQESVFEQLRVVREGQLRIVFSPELKICSWEFCARRHEELIPRRLIIPQVSQLGNVVQKYQVAAQNSSSGLSTHDLQNTCNSFVASARQLAKALEVPLVNDLGYTKRYVRCLQISEVVNSMKDLIDYSRETGTGPMESLINFPRRNGASSGLHVQLGQQPEQQQTMTPSSNLNDQSSSHVIETQLVSMNGVMRGNNSLNGSLVTSPTTVAGLLHQNSMNSRQENQQSNMNSSYVAGANTIQIPSASSSNSLPPSKPNTSSSFPSPTLSASNNVTPTTSHNTSHMNRASSPGPLATLQQQATTNSQLEYPTDSLRSVEQILQDMMTSQFNGADNIGNDMKGLNGITPAMNGGNYFVGNGIVNGPGMSSMSFGSMGSSGGGVSSSAAAVSGLRGAMANNAIALNGRLGQIQVPRDSSTANHQQQHHDLGSDLFSGLGAVNNFNNFQFDWKASP